MTASGWASLLPALALVTACSAAVVTPVPASTRVTLTVSVDPDGGGEVRVLPPGQRDGSIPGARVYERGETVTLTASPTDGFEFERWSAAVAGSGDRTVLLLEADTRVEAIFRPIAAPVQPTTMPTLTSPPLLAPTATIEPPATPMPGPTAAPTLGARARVLLASESAQEGRTFEVTVWVDPASASIAGGEVTLTYPVELVGFVSSALSPLAEGAYSGSPGSENETGRTSIAIVLDDGANPIDVPGELVVFTFFATTAGVAEFVPSLDLTGPDSSPIVVLVSYSDVIIIQPRPGVAATCFTTSAILTWSDPDGLQVMRLERRKSGGDFFQRALVVAGKGQFDDDNLSAETTYEYRLTATVAGGDTGVAHVNCTTDDGRVPLVPPASVVSARRVENAVVVTIADWSACDRIEWGTVEEQVAGTFVATARIWEATADTPCTALFMPVVSHSFDIPNDATGSLIFEAWGEAVHEFTLTSAEGDEVSAPVLFLTTDETSAQITWEHDKVNVDHFTLDREIGVGSGYATVQPDIRAQVGSITDAGLFSGTVYCWRLRAVSPRGTRSEASELCSQTEGLSDLVFATERDGNSEIYVMLEDGGAQVRLTTNTAADIQPAWSPDRSKIAFSSRRGGTWDIWVMDADGSNPTQLTTGGSNDWAPAWSPDGTKIAWSAFRDGDPEIYVMDADGSGQTRLTTAQGEDTNPSWSPDGSRIAFDSRRDGNKELYVMDANGANATRLTNNRARDEAPAWSPDGNKLAFSRDSQIYVMNASGGNDVALTSSDGRNQAPSWSRDGTKILFESSRDGDFEIYVMSAGGAYETQLTTNDVLDGHPDW